ncbi:MAG: hypothetical protein WCY32_08910 [Burkholderiaceae bacterium]
MSRRLHTALGAGSLILGLAVAAPQAAADTIVGPWDINVNWINVITDRIGDSRYFAGSGTDVIRVSAGVHPSPDSDFYGNLYQGDLYRSSNGGQTTVSVTHASFDNYNFLQPLTFVGQSSGGGGARDEYTRIFNLSNQAIIDRLDAIQQTPFRLVVENPDVPAGPTLVNVNAPDYSHQLLPFLTDIKLTGGGLLPTISWIVPESGEAVATNVRIQVRRIEAESADGKQITAAKLVHEAILDLDASGYQFGEQFSQVATPGFPAGLEVGERYEMAVILELRDPDANRTLARARTFFEFMPLPEGAGEVAVFLPSVGPNGEFKFNVKVEAGETIAIDPVVAVGYDYQIGDGDPWFASVTLPDVGDGLYELYLFNGADWVFEAVLAAGNEYLFAAGGVDRFRILGIETSAGLNPSDPVAFITELTFTGDGRFTGTMTPITVEVPVPGTLTLFGLALALLVGARPISRRFRPTSARAISPLASTGRMQLNPS